MLVVFNETKVPVNGLVFKNWAEFPVGKLMKVIEGCEAGKLGYKHSDHETEDGLFGFAPNEGYIFTWGDKLDSYRWEEVKGSVTITF